MFYKCSICGKILTEFDVNFTRNLKGSFDGGNSKCANCMAKTNYLHTLRKPNLFNYIFPYLVIICFVWFINQTRKENFFNQPGIGAISAIFFIASFIGYIICTIRCVRDFKGLKDESYETSCVRTTYDSSTNSLVTSKSTEYVGDDHISEKMWLFFIYPIWGIFVYFYRLIKYYREVKKNYTNEVIQAYNKTKVETEKFIFPNKFCYPHNVEEMFKIKEEKFKKEKESIISKYSYLGKNKVEQKIKELKPPTIKIHSTKKSYNLITSNIVSDNKNNYKIIESDYAAYITAKKEIKEYVKKNIQNMWYK